MLPKDTSVLHTGEIPSSPQILHPSAPPPTPPRRSLPIFRRVEPLLMLLLPLFSAAGIVRKKQWCEMVPCLEDEGCDLLVNKSGWTCTQPGGRVKTTTVSSAPREAAGSPRSTKSTVSASFSVTNLPFRPLIFPTQWAKFQISSLRLKHIWFGDIYKKPYFDPPPLQ